MAPRAQPVLGHRTASCRHPRGSSRRNAWQPCLPAVLSSLLKPSHNTTSRPRTNAGLVGGRSSLAPPSGRPQHRSSSTLRACGRSVLTPPHGQGMPTAADQHETQHSKGVDGPTPFRHAATSTTSSVGEEREQRGPFPHPRSTAWSRSLSGRACASAPRCDVHRQAA
jgi:hypothetical protein